MSLPTPTATHARLAGLAYLVIIVTGVGGEVALRGPLVVPGDAAATAANVVASEGLFRLSLLADAAMAVADVSLAALLMVILWRSGPLLAIGATLFRLVQTSILGLNLLQLHQAHALFADPTLAPGAEQLGLQLLTAHGVGYDLGLIFFAVNSALTGVLLWRNEAFPRALGAGLIASGAVYLLGSTFTLVAPELSASFEAAYLVPLLAESAVCLWLLFRADQVAATADASASRQRRSTSLSSAGMR